MDLEIIAITLALAASVWTVHRQRPGPAAWILTTAILAGAAVGSSLQYQALEARAQARERVLSEVPVLERDADGFASSESCKACHPAEYETWHDSYHRTMTQLATPESVVGNFDGVTLESFGRTFELKTDQDGFHVRMMDPEWERNRMRKNLPLGPPEARPRVTRPVVMVTGSHHMQTYWVPSSAGNELLNLPFVYLFENQRWIPREHAFLRPPGAGVFRQRWNDNCLGCHATYGQPKGSREGWKTRVAELGIACEACHGPADEHVTKHRSLLGRYAAHLSDGPDPTIVNPARLPAARSSEVCGQCHSKSWIKDARRFNDAGLAYRPGGELARSKTVVLPRSNGDHPWLRQSLKMDPAFVEQFFWSDGMIRVSGREYNGMVESACYGGGEMSCLSCHSMHDGEPNLQLRRGHEGDRACLDCHPDYAEALQAHTHHPPDSSGSSCVNCHMPYTSYGLLRGLRSHLVNSPTVSASLETGRPNACNQCHLDRTLEWTDRHLTSWWGHASTRLDAADREIAASVRWLLEGDAAQRALMAFSYGWEPAREASGTDWMPPFLAVLLEDPYAAVRHIAGRSLKRMPGYEDLVYDPLAPPEGRAEARSGAEARYSVPTEARPAVLLRGPDGLDRDTLEKLLRQRDDRPVDLKE